MGKSFCNSLMHDLMLDLFINRYEFGVAI